MKPVDPGRDLAALLARRREEVQAAWSHLLRELPGSHYQSRSTEELAAWACQGVDAIIASLESGSSEPLEAHADRVSTVRSRLGFEIHEVVQGLLLLKETSLAEIVKAYRHDPGRVRDATLLLDRGVRLMLARFVARFAALMQDSVKREQERTRLLLEVAEAAGSSLDLERVLSVVADSVNRALQGAHCTILSWDEPAQAFCPRAWAGRIENRQLRAALRRPMKRDADPLIARTLSTLEPVTWGITDQDTLLPAGLCKASGIGGAVAIPILLADRILALALVLLEEPDASCRLEERIGLASGVASAAAPALDNARRYCEARATLAESRRLEKVTASFLGVHGLREVLELICREIRGLTGAEGATIYLPDTNGEPGRVFSSGSAAGTAARPQLSLALTVEGHPIGKLQLYDLPDGVEEREAGFLDRFADHAAAAIEHATYHEQKEELAALEERQHLAHELHDSVTQSLYGVTMFAEAAARLHEAGDHAKAGRLLRQMKDVSLKALREMRLLIFDLRPPLFAERGLVATLQARLSAVEGRAGVQTRLDAEGVESLPEALASGLYGICTEALNNSLKHAMASRISVRLRALGPTARLEVQDDGQGFDSTAARSAGGMGLVGMEERAARLGARLSVTSRVGAGTCVTVEAPLKTSPGHLDPRQGAT